jgi:hypothetical protein
MSRAEALLLLAENSFNFKRFGSAGLGVLRGVVSGADCYRLRIADLESAVRAISDLVRAAAGSPGELLGHALMTSGDGPMETSAGKIR